VHPLDCGRAGLCGLVEHPEHAIAVLGDVRDGFGCRIEPGAHVIDREVGGLTFFGAETCREVGMYLCHRGTETLCVAREVAAEFCCVQIGFGEEIPHTDQGHAPAVGGVLDELLSHAQRRGLTVDVGLDPSAQSGDVLTPHLAERPMEFHIRIDPDFYLTKSLEQQRLSVYHRRVRLFHTQTSTRIREVDGDVGQRPEPQRSQVFLTGQRGEVPGEDVRVVQSVVPCGDIRWRFGQRPCQQWVGQVCPEAERDLITLLRTRLEIDFHQHMFSGKALLIEEWNAGSIPSVPPVSGRRTERGRG